MRTGFYFQLARGRALARTNAMKRARWLHRVLAKDDLTAMRWDLDPEYRHTLYDESVREVTRHKLGLEVQAARRANRDWRRYRRSHVELERD